MHQHPRESFTTTVKLDKYQAFYQGLDFSDFNVQYGLQVNKMVSIVTWWASNKRYDRQLK